MESRWTTAIILLLSLFILLFFAGQFFFSHGEEIRTQTAYSYSTTEAVPFEGVYLRDETLIYGSVGNGVLSYEYADGSKVGKSSVIARRYANENDIEYRREIETLQKQIDVLSDAQKLVGTDNTQLETIANQINEKHSSIITCLIDGDYSGAEELESEMLGALCKREITKGSIEGYSGKIQALKNRAAELQALISGSIQDIYANDSGYFVSRIDGYESRLSFSDTQLTADEIEEIIRKPDVSGSQKAIGKLISGYRWRVAAVLERDKLFGMYEESTVTLRVGSSAVPIEAEIISITDTDRNDGTAVYVFECDRLTSDVVEGRTAQFKLVINSYGGIRVPREAIRYNEKDERGVFVVSSGKLNFRKINVVYWGDDYIICSRETDDDFLKLYDKIVTEGKDLYDGKVVE